MKKRKGKLILGPPGTGKTTTLLNLVDDLLKRGYDPEQIAFVSFTKKAASEAADRARSKFAGLPAVSFKYFKTLHSLAYWRLGLAKSDVLGDEHLKNIATLAGLPYKGAKFSLGEPYANEGEIGDRALFWYGKAQSIMIRYEQMYECLSNEERWELPKPQYMRYCLTYETYKNEMGLIDFADMLRNAVKMGPVNEIKIAIIDEAQDLSKLQWHFVDAVFANVDEMYVAGDDDQAIYTWSGADIEIFQSYSDILSETEVLRHSYRLPEKIWQFANLVSSKISARLEKEWGPNENSGIVKAHAGFRHVPIECDRDKWLILVRNNYQLKEISSILEQKGIPYILNDRKSVRTRHYDGITAWLTLQKEEAITPAKARLVYDLMKPQDQFEPEGREKLDRLTGRELFYYSDLVNNFGLLTAQDTDWWDALPYIDQKRGAERSDMRMYIRRCLRHKEDIKNPRVQLSTIHAAKGGEADKVVLFAEMSSRNLKGLEKNPDSEHRAFYVGATRAKKELHLVLTDTRKGYPFPSLRVLNSQERINSRVG